MLHVMPNDYIVLHVTKKRFLMASSVTARVQKRRDVLRAAGLRPIQIWVPDTRRPAFAEECRRESSLAARADQGDLALLGFLDDALGDVDGWSA